jgi:hypothetical protein
MGKQLGKGEAVQSDAKSLESRHPAARQEVARRRKCPRPASAAGYAGLLSGRNRCGSVRAVPAAVVVSAGAGAREGAAVRKPVRCRRRWNASVCCGGGHGLAECGAEPPPGVWAEVSAAVPACPVCPRRCPPQAVAMPGCHRLGRLLQCPVATVLGWPAVSGRPPCQAGGLLRGRQCPRADGARTSADTRTADRQPGRVHVSGARG